MSTEISDDTLNQIIMVLDNYRAFMKADGYFVPTWTKKVTKLRNELLDIQNERILKDKGVKCLNL